MCKLQWSHVGSNFTAAGVTYAIMLKLQLSHVGSNFTAIGMTYTVGSINI